MEKTIKFIKNKSPKITPRLAIILGSGLGKLTEQLTNSVKIPYEEIPNFPTCGVQGHGGALHIGYLGSIPVACLAGRIHLYEGIDGIEIKKFVRTMKLLGCKTLMVTNSAGSIDPSISVGNLMLVKDHINFQFRNPLIGKNDEEYGPRFPGMDATYDKELRTYLKKVAQEKNISLSEGVFGGTLGPSFETPAEVQMLSILGVKAVAMSLISEVIVARHCGMRVVAISAITNLAAGLYQGGELSHEVTLNGAKVASKNLITLIEECCSREDSPF